MSDKPAVTETKMATGRDTQVATVTDLWVALRNGDRALAQSRHFLGMILSELKTDPGTPIPGIDRKTLEVILDRDQWGPIKCPTWPVCFTTPRMIAVQIKELASSFQAVSAATTALAALLPDKEFPVYKDEPKS